MAVRDFYLHEMGIDIYQLRKKPYNMAKLNNLIKNNSQYNFPIPSKFSNNCLIFSEKLIADSTIKLLFDNIIKGIKSLDITPSVMILPYKLDNILLEYIKIINPELIIIFKLNDKLNSNLEENLVNHNLKTYNLKNVLDDFKLKKDLFYDFVNTLDK